MSIARRTFPSRLELKRPAGSFRDAPFAKVSFTTYTHVAGNPLPTLGETCKKALGNFAIASNAKVLRDMGQDIAFEAEAGGSVTTTVKLKQGFDINALASADVPVAGTLEVQPNVSLSLGGSLELDGDLIVRAFKTSASDLTFGVYVKTGTTLKVTFTAEAGLEGDIGDNDILAKLLNAALPQVDVNAAGITGDEAKALNKVVKDALDGR